MNHHLMKTILIYKKTQYELYHAKKSERHAIQDKAFYSCLEKTHKEYAQAISIVERCLKKHGIAYEKKYRRALKAEQADLAVCVGGDGTFLEAAHKIKGDLLLVNANPKDSVAFYSCCTAMTFEKTFGKYLAGKTSILKLARLHLEKNGKTLPERPVNDILFSHADPAGMTRYDLAIRTIHGRHEEEQKSSGIWIAAPGGTTAAIRSAGGAVIPLAERKFEFVVREHYRTRHHTGGLVQGILKDGEEFTLTSKTRRGKIFIDGSHITHNLGLFDRLTITLDKAPLRVVGLDLKRQEAYK